MVLGSLFGEYITVFWQISITSYICQLCGDGQNVAMTDDAVQRGLSHWGVQGTLTESYLSFSNIRSNIKAGKPIYAGWSWNDGGGHALVIRGSDSISTTSGDVLYMEPKVGAFHVMSYAEFKGGTSSSYDHIWDGTIYNLHV